MRKTITVDDLKSKVNRMLAVPTRYLPAGQKQILCSLLEEVLFETGNYQGYGWPNLTAERAAAVTSDDAEYYSRRYI